MNVEIVDYPVEATIMKKLEWATSGDGSRFLKIEIPARIAETEPWVLRSQETLYD
jgi:hypothetical protein